MVSDDKKRRIQMLKFSKKVHPILPLLLFCNCILFKQIKSVPIDLDEVSVADELKSEQDEEESITKVPSTGASESPDDYEPLPESNFSLSTIFDSKYHDQLGVRPVTLNESELRWPGPDELAQIYANPNYHPMENDALFQGDIMDNSMPSSSKTAVRIFNLWPFGLIPYTMDLSLIPYRDKIRAAMNEIESKTCIRFRMRLFSRDYVNMGSGAGCYSAIGRSGTGGQVLSLGPGCDAHTTILHELMHAIGFEHMHSHRDRDNFIRVKWENIPRDKWKQFEVVSIISYKHIVPFDYESVMLYGPRTFGNGQITMESKLEDKKVIEMHEKPGLSKADVDGINRLYLCRRRGATWTSGLTAAAASAVTNV